jgi:transposase InsO family protein
MVDMIGWEDDKLLKVKGTSTWAQNFAYLSHHDEGTFSSSFSWNARFGHINYDSLHVLKKNGVSGLPTILRNSKQCEACILVKRNKKHFHDSTSRARRKIELVHLDLCGPILVPSTFGKIYIMTFIDDYTRTCWVYLLKQKSQAFETFKKFHLWIENEAQSLIGTLCTNNGGEYTSNEFESYLFQHEIKHQTTIPYNPQHNGVEKRINKTLLNMVRLMLFFKNVKLLFLGRCSSMCSVCEKQESISCSWEQDSL